MHSLLRMIDDILLDENIIAVYNAAVPGFSSSKLWQSTRRNRRRDGPPWLLCEKRALRLHHACGLGHRNAVTTEDSMAAGIVGKVIIIKLLMLTHCLLSSWLLFGVLAPVPWLRYLYKHKSQTAQLDLTVGSIVEIFWPPLNWRCPCTSK